MRFGKKLPNETQTSHFQKGKPENHPLGDMWVVGCFILLLAAAYITGGTGNILENYGVTDIGDVSVLAIESWTWIGHYQHSACNFMECQVKMWLKKTLNIDISKSNSRFLQLVQLYCLRLSSLLLSLDPFGFTSSQWRIRLPTENTPGRHHTACRGIGNQLLVMGGGRRPSDKAWILQYDSNVEREGYSSPGKLTNTEYPLKKGLFSVPIPCIFLVYLPTFGGIFMIKCKSIYHTWMVWGRKMQHLKQPLIFISGDHSGSDGEEWRVSVIGIPDTKIVIILGGHCFWGHAPIFICFCVSYIYIYTWNLKKKPCFEWSERAFFWRVRSLQNRGRSQVPGVKYIYIIYILYIYILVYIYIAGTWNIYLQMVVSIGWFQVSI